MSDEQREHTLDEKRAFVREHLASQAKEARDQAKYYLAVANGRATFVAYCDRRSATVEQIEEVELDLMIANWRARVAQETARRTTFTEDAVERVMFLRYDGVLGPKVTAAPMLPVLVTATIAMETEPPKDPT